MEGASIYRRQIIFGGITLIGAVLTLACLFSLHAHATTTISQSYASKSDLPVGSIVSLETNTTDSVVASSTDNTDNIFGVVISSTGSLLTVTNEGKSQVQVATSGTLPVLVSNVNGDIKRGDHITASPFRGIGMKAINNSRIIGIAEGTMVGKKKEKYKTKDGKEQEVTVGQVSVLVNVAYFFKEPEKTLVPAALQNVANGLAGKKVESLPILLASGVFLITLIIVASFVYSMIHSSIISVGRNPMSQAAIYRDLLQMSSLVLTILAAGMVAIYLILTRL
jgi:hypothetical protein